MKNDSYIFSRNLESDVTKNYLSGECKMVDIKEMKRNVYLKSPKEAKS